MDELDLRILEILENGLALVQKPYEELGRQLGLDGGLIFDRVRRLTKAGVIRRIGPALDSRRMGFCSTLAAVRVPDQQVERAAGLVRNFAEVTHCYLRQDDFNIWFTIIAPDTAETERIVDHIRRALSLEPGDILNLPAKRVFKLKVRFAAQGYGIAADNQPPPTKQAGNEG